MEICRYGENPKAILSEDDPRPPLRGEWYLSGAVVEAYRAPNDLTAKYHVARLTKNPNQ